MNKIQVFIGMLLFILVVCIILIDDKSERKYKPSINNRSIVIKSDTFSKDNLWGEILKDSIEHPEIVMNQAKLETGNFKSQMFKLKNNLWGFRGKNGYMKFTSWKECVMFYKKWQTKRYKKGNYYQFLENIKFAEDSNYINRLKQF